MFVGPYLCFSIHKLNFFERLSVMSLQFIELIAVRCVPVYYTHLCYVVYLIRTQTIQSGTQTKNKLLLGYWGKRENAPEWKRKKKQQSLFAERLVCPKTKLSFF